MTPYRLVGADGRPYESSRPGTFGGHRRSRIYGRLDCPSALRWIAHGHYVRHRVFFADEGTARAAGYRPCAVCLPAEYAAWRNAGAHPPTPPASDVTSLPSDARDATSLPSRRGAASSNRADHG